MLLDEPASLAALAGPEAFWRITSSRSSGMARHPVSDNQSGEPTKKRPRGMRPAWPLSLAGVTGSDQLPMSPDQVVYFHLYPCNGVDEVELCVLQAVVTHVDNRSTVCISLHCSTRDDRFEIRPHDSVHATHLGVVHELVDTAPALSLPVAQRFDPTSRPTTLRNLKQSTTVFSIP